MRCERKRGGEVRGEEEKGGLMTSGRKRLERKGGEG